MTASGLLVLFIFAGVSLLEASFVCTLRFVSANETFYAATPFGSDPLPFGRPRR